MKNPQFNSQPDLINTTRITHTLFFTSSTFNQVFNLLDLFSAQLLHYGTPFKNFPATWSTLFLVSKDSLDCLLPLLPFDPCLQDDLQRQNYPPSYPNALNQSHERPENSSVPF